MNFNSVPNELTFDLSAKSGEGFDALLEQLTKHAETYLEGAEAAFVTRQRHRRTLEDVVAALQRALRGDPDREDLLAEELQNRGSCARPPHRPGRRGRRPGRDLSRFLHWQVTAFRGRAQLRNVSRETRR